MHPDPAEAPPGGGATEPAGPWPTPPPDDTPFDPFGLSTPLPRPINWDQLDPADLETAWHELDDWVNWLRRTYGLPASIIPPAWHRHPELRLELSALHLHWQSAYHPDQHASAPLGWHRDLTDTLQRLRDWTATGGTRLDHDRPTRHTPWPGERPGVDPAGGTIHNRAADFARYVAEDVSARHALQGASTGIVGGVGTKGFIASDRSEPGRSAEKGAIR